MHSNILPDWFAIFFKSVIDYHVYTAHLKDGTNITYSQADVCISNGYFLAKDIWDENPSGYNQTKKMKYIKFSDIETIIGDEGHNDYIGKDEKFIDWNKCSLCNNEQPISHKHFE